MRLRRVSDREYVCCDDPWFAITASDGRWRIIAGGCTLGESHGSRQSAAAALAVILTGGLAGCGRGPAPRRRCSTWRRS
jgi:hypothetical protein